jgi:voltage-gated potassium channel
MNSNGYEPSQTGDSASQRTLRKGISFFAGTCVVATLGYVAAGWEWLDAIYMVTITIFGVGYGEVHPIDEPWLKYFTMAVIFAGCSSLIFVIGGIVQMITEGEIARIMGTRIRSKEIDQLHDHTIICGYGRIGQMLAIELNEQSHSMVILDRDPARVAQALASGFLAIVGDAADDTVLSQVGIFRARTLATVLPDDATNVFITLSARDLCESINIIARAECPSTERKLLRGGATSVVMPAAIGAIRIAQLAAQAQTDAEQLPEDRYRMLQRYEKRANLDPQPSGEDELVKEVEHLAELAAETTHAEDVHILEEIAKANL